LKIPIHPTSVAMDAIIAVGFRVNPARAIQFLLWATGVLRDFSVRGYVLDKERWALEAARAGD
jgi:hypothetical protein